MAHKLGKVSRSRGDRCTVLNPSLIRVEIRNGNADKRYYDLDEWVVASVLGSVLFLRPRMIQTQIG